MLLVCAGLMVFAAVSASAANNDSATITFEVQAINELAISGDPGALVISTATAGSEPDAVSDATTTYAITCNETGHKITAQIDSAMPANVTLTIELEACSTSISPGPVDISDATAKDVLTDIDLVAESGKTITYGLAATVAAGVVASQSRTVTLTLISD